MFKKVFSKDGLYTTWRVLILLLILVCLLLFFTPLKTISENLLAEVFGLIGTLLIVERIIRYQKDKETEPVRKIGYMRIGTNIEVILDYITLVWDSRPEKWDDPDYEIPDDRMELWQDEMDGVNRSNTQLNNILTIENTKDTLIDIRTNLEEAYLRFESVLKEGDKSLLLEIESQLHIHINQLYAMIRHLERIRDNDRLEIHKRRLDMLKMTGNKLYETALKGYIYFVDEGLSKPT